ncbi:hypothetical protein C8Q78DRAFT_271034 [Trametes maxima]|nr:hypothetical protein C8Q78DRAFT_271034 [Trametes maxima]
MRHSSVDMKGPSNTAVLPLSDTLGAIYLGLLAGMMLYGLTVHQTYRYYKLYPKDRLYIKALVIIIVVLETFHSVLWNIVGYHYLITEAMNIRGLLLAHWSQKLCVIETGFAIFSCQSYYACRVYLIGPRYRWLVIPAVVSMVTGLGLAIAAGVEAFMYVQSVSDFEHVSWLVSSGYGLAVATDVILTSALVFVLRKSRTSSRRANSVLHILTIYSINTGVLTSIFGVAVFVFALIIPGNLIYAGISIVGVKLYANSVLAVLNSRKSIDNQFVSGFNESFSVVEGPPRACSSASRSRQAPRHDLDSAVFWEREDQCESGCVPVDSADSQELSFAVVAIAGHPEVALGERP